MFNNKLKISLLLFLANCLISTTSIKASSDSSQKINTLLIQGKYQNAYQLAQDMSMQEMGNPLFDLSLAKAALANKKPDEAIMAFERVLMNDPNNVNARFGLAVAYYQLKVYDKAQIELQTLNLNPNSAALSNEMRTLSTKISKGLAAENRSYSLYGRMVYGYDNNANAASDDDYTRYLDLTGQHFDTSGYNADQLAAYNDLLKKLRKYNDNIKSTYLYPQFGIRGRNEFKSKFGFFWDLNASHKEYLEVDNLDINQANITLSLNYKISHLYTLAGSFYYQEYGVDGERYREAPIGSLSLSRTLNANNIIKLYTDNGVLSYPHYRSQSINMHVGGIEWWCYNDRNTLVTQAFYGRNAPRKNTDHHHSNDYYGIDISAKHKANETITFALGGTYQGSIYDEKEFVDAPRRNDAFMQYSGGVYYTLCPKCTWYVLGTYTNNLSNVFMYAYDRFEALTGISFEL